MLPVERRKRILEELGNRGAVQVDQLACNMNVTQMTIRRDLDKLADEGKLERTHGGAVIAQWLSDEDNYEIKQSKNQSVKQAIAEMALEYIKPDMTIFLDAGTTTYELAKKLVRAEGLTIITGDIKIANLLYDTKNTLYVVGGMVESSTGAIFSAEQDYFMSHINIDCAFIGTSALSEEGMITTPTFDKANLKKLAYRAASRAILLVDHSKYGLRSLVKVARLEDFQSVITDIDYDEEEIKHYSQVEIRQVQVKEEV